MYKEFEPVYFFSSLLGVAKSVLLTPAVFYQGMKRQGGTANPFLYMMVCIVFHTVVSGIFFQDRESVLRSLGPCLFFPLISSVMFYLVLRTLFKKRLLFENVFRINAYAATVTLLSWIPLIGMLFELYRLYLLMSGLQNSLALKTRDAVVTIVLAIIVYLAVSVLMSQSIGVNRIFT